MLVTAVKGWHSISPLVQSQSHTTVSTSSTPTYSLSPLDGTSLVLQPLIAHAVWIQCLCRWLASRSLCDQVLPRWSNWSTLSIRVTYSQWCTWLQRTKLHAIWMTRSRPDPTPPPKSTPPPPALPPPTYNRYIDVIYTKPRKYMEQKIRRKNRKIRIISETTHFCK